MKRVILILVVIILLCSVLNINTVAENRVFNFYCKRNSTHKQPTLDSNMQFIERYNAYYVDRVHNDTNSERVIYLTFDAGYENGNIAKTLDVLDRENVKAAFFILRNLPDKNSDLLIRMVEAGHLICNHTSMHPDMTKINTIENFSKELAELEKVYKEKTGFEMSKYYRPPCGKFSEQNLEFAKTLGYKTIMWSFAYADWDNNKQPSCEYAKKIIMDNIHNGEIMLLHPTSKTNAEILGDIIIELKNQGYRFGTLDELE